MDTDRIEGAARDVGGKVKEVAGDVTGDEGMQADGVVQQVAGKAQNIYGFAKDAAQGAAQSAANVAGNAYDRGDQYASNISNTARDEIREHPLSTALVAAFVGYVVALILHGRR